MRKKYKSMLLDVAVHKKLKSLSVALDKPMKEIISELVEDYGKKGLKDEVSNRK